MISGILGQALSGLNVAQRSMETVSNNIANVNTEGYSRQKAIQQTRLGGSGVEIATIARNYDQFLSSQMRSSTSAFNQVDSYYNLASNVDNMMADKSTSFSTTMGAFFDAVNAVANDPGSLAARQTMLSEANSMTDTLNTMGARFNEINDQVNGNINNLVKDLNTYTNQIASLNNDIVDAINTSSSRQQPNDLLDQRDQLLNKLAQIVGISVSEQSDGSMNVFIGNGQPLVVRNTASTLTVKGSQFNAAYQDIYLSGQNVSEQFSGGELTGNLQFRKEVLAPAQQQLGLAATGLATEFNNIHQTGFDLDGNAGSSSFFELGTPGVQVIGHNRDPNLKASTTFTAPTSAANLASAYKLDILAGNQYTLTSLDDNSVLASGGLPAATTAYGFDISFNSGTLYAGDSFTISPTVDIAKTIRVNPNISARQIAAAGVANQPGDNTVALSLAGLEKSSIMHNGQSTLSQVYQNQVTHVGSSTHAALISRSAQDTLLKQATTAKENLSGVNLDEEAGDLVKYQQSYQAAAQTVSMAKSLFDSILNAIH